LLLFLNKEHCYLGLTFFFKKKKRVLVFPKTLYCIFLWLIYRRSNIFVVNATLHANITYYKNNPFLKFFFRVITGRSQRKFFYITSNSPQGTNLTSISKSWILILWILWWRNSRNIIRNYNYANQMIIITRSDRALV
jgi:hypothetical protein